MEPPFPKFQILQSTATNLNIASQIDANSPDSLILRYKNQAHTITLTKYNLNSRTAVIKACNKAQLGIVCQQLDIHSPKKFVVSSLFQYKTIYQNISFPQVIKPYKGEKGKKVFINITSFQQAIACLKAIFTESTAAVVEEFVQGNDLRLLCLNQKIIGACQRWPSQVIGDGKSTIIQLINQENQKRKVLEKVNQRRTLSPIDTSPDLTLSLKTQGLSKKYITSPHQPILPFLINNVSKGGQVRTVNIDTIHSTIRSQAINLVRHLKLNFASVDYIVKDLSQPASNTNTSVIEINTNPSIRLHEWPNQGNPQPVAQHILKYIFSLN